MWWTKLKPLVSGHQEKFSKPDAGGGKVAVLQGQVKEVQGVMRQNIESVIQRGERLDDLMDKTDELEAAVRVWLVWYGHCYIYILVL